MESIKEVIKEKYGTIASSAPDPAVSCCSPPAASGVTSCCAADEYTEIGPLEVANLGLGCGTPVEFADIGEGMSVLDLGSGAGIDVFLAAKEVGSSGHVIGVDMTEPMIERARKNALALAIRNVEFRLGEIESLPVESDTIDRILSNCVLNLVPDKRKAFAEIHRVLRPGGKFAVSDIVTTGAMPKNIRLDAALWAGCVAGALDKDEYLAIAREAGLGDVTVVKERSYGEFTSNEWSLLSVTVTGKKPG